MRDFTPAIFAGHGIDVSRETCERFEKYHALLLKWQAAINLVGASTLDDVFIRHFLDSAQLLNCITSKEIVLADMGSGAGFPGMVLAILGVRDVHLIESDVRKATFLREVSRETNTPVTIHDQRVEDVKVPHIDLVTARALAPLVDLLKMAKTLGVKNCLFMKGAQAEEEVAKARKKFDFNVEMIKSITDPEAKILKISLQ